MTHFPFLNELLLSCGIDFLLHPLHLAETRFICQNRKPNFRTYHSLLDMVKMTGLKEFVRGITLHIPRNVCIALSKYISYANDDVCSWNEVE